MLSPFDSALISSLHSTLFFLRRTTGDPEPGWGTIMRELNSLRKVVNPAYPNAKRGGAPEYNANPPRSRPGESTAP
jgi:hypothetical protein